jgi:hypothetical protein
MGYRNSKLCEFECEYLPVGFKLVALPIIRGTLSGLIQLQSLDSFSRYENFELPGDQV